MWIALFSIVIAAAMCFTMAAILLGPIRQDSSARREQKRARIVEFVRRCRGLGQAACAGLEQKPFDILDERTGWASPPDMMRSNVLMSGQGTASLKCRPKERQIKHGADVGPLLRRIALLKIESDKLDLADPLLFRELQGVCVLC